MRCYTVHVRPGSDRPDRDPVLVKEGFAWGAFFFSVIWALWHRMWVAAVALLAILALIDVGGDLAGLDPVSDFALGLAVALLIGWGANDWRRASLARQGFELAGIVAATGHDAALRRWFDLSPG